MSKFIFRKTAPKNEKVHGGVTDTSVYVSVPVESAEGTSVLSNSVLAEDYSKTISLPTSEEYSLKNLIAAGVPLREVPVLGMLDDSDPTSWTNVSATAQATEAIQKEMSNSNSDDK